MRPDLHLLLGILGICLLAILLFGCAADRAPAGGIGFDLLGALIGGII